MIPVIDAHQHFWHYHPETHDWITEEMAVIRRDFLPDDLAAIFSENGVAGSVAVQADQTEEETVRLLNWAANHPFIKGVVGWVDLRSSNIEERLTHFRQFPLLKGFRHILQVEEPAFMLQPDFVNGIAALGRHGFSYDLLLLPHHLEAATKLVKQFPDQPFVVDHLAKPYIKDGKMEQWKKDISELAQYPNVCCKLSGMVTEADWSKWTKDDLYPYIDVAVNTFGMNRLMFGSDWPVCLVAGTYNAWISTVRNYFAGFSENEQLQLFSGNATAFYNL